MDERSVEHSTFGIERTFSAVPERVYQAWTNPKMKSEWYGPTNEKSELSLDFRVSGRERFIGKAPNGIAFEYNATFHEIVPNNRIVYCYTMDVGTKRISVSLVTIDISAAGHGSTQLLLTEQVVFLDGTDSPADREQGNHDMLDALATALSD